MNERSNESDLLALIAAADFGDGDPEARARLDDRLREDPDARARHDEVLGLWNAVGRLSPPPITSAEALPVSWRRRGGRLAVRATAVAAAALLVISAMTGLMRGTTGSAQAFTIETGKAERRIARLPDGSTVELSGETRVTVRYAENRRELSLDSGEAYLQAAPRRDPFVIRAGDGEIRTHGAIDIKRVRGDVLVTTVRGDAAVAVDNGVQTASLANGEQLRLSASLGAAPGAVLTNPKPVSVAGVLDWTRGFLEFHGEPLADVIDEVNRHAAGKVVLLDKSQANLPIYGVLRLGDLDGLASILADQQTARGRTAHIVRVDADPE